MADERLTITQYWRDWLASHTERHRSLDTSWDAVLQDLARLEADWLVRGANLASLQCELGKVRKEHWELSCRIARLIDVAVEETERRA